MSLHIEKAGMLDTIQDAGRHGFGQLGVNPNGPMDWHAHQLSNALVGNELKAPVFEFHYPAPVIRFNKPCLIALAGADFDAQVNGLSVFRNKTVFVPAGAQLRFRRKLWGERVCMAIGGCLHIESTLGSCATNIKAGFGGWQGRALQAGDEILFTANTPMAGSEMKTFPWQARPSLYHATAIRCLTGPEWDWLTAQQQGNVLESAFAIHARSDRMAIRLHAKHMDARVHRQMVSSPVVMGTVQLLPDGDLLVLMADHQTVGGYPRILQVAAIDLPTLSQRSVGAAVELSVVAFEDALTLYKDTLNDLNILLQSVRAALQGMNAL